jgi:hypothetical protein
LTTFNSSICFIRALPYVRHDMLLYIFRFVKADVLVNSTLSNLNHPTACGRALQNRGGLSYIEVCKPHTNIPPWGIVCTTGGNLSCQYIIHAVCCNWNKEDKVKSEQVCRMPASYCYVFRLYFHSTCIIGQKFPILSIRPCMVT